MIVNDQAGQPCPFPARCATIVRALLAGPILGVSLGTAAPPVAIDPVEISRAVENLELHVTVEASRDLSRIKHSARFRFRFRSDRPTDVFFFFPGIETIEEFERILLNDAAVPAGSLRVARHPEYDTPVFVVPADVFAERDPTVDLRLSVDGPWFNNDEGHYTRWGGWHPYLVSRLDPVPVTLKVTAAADLVVIGSGRAIDSAPVRDGISTRTWASGRPIGWMFLTIGDYRRSTLSKDGLALDVYWPAAHEDFDPQAIGQTPFDILEFYTRHFGVPVVGTMQLVEIPVDPVNNFAVNGTIAMSYGSWEAVKRSPIYLESALAHEIAHFWWGDTITPTGSGLRFLSESFAEYSRYLYEREHGIEPLTWGFRNGLMLSQFAGTEPPPIDGPPVHGDDETIYYQKGCFVLHMLEQLIGPDVMDSVISGFARRHRAKTATIRDFVRAVEIGTNDEWDWFFEQWLRRSTGPRFSLEGMVVNRTQGEYRLRGRVRQHTSQPYRLRVTMRVNDTSGASIDRVLEVDEAATPIDIRLERRPTAAVLDPENDLFKWFEITDLPVSFADANVLLAGGTEVGTVGLDGFFGEAEQKRMFRSWFGDRFPSSQLVTNGSGPFRLLFGEDAAQYRAGRGLRSVPEAPPDSLAVYIARGTSVPGEIIVGVEGAVPASWPEIFPDGPYWYIQLQNGNYTKVFGTTLPSVRWDAPPQPDEGDD